MLRVADACTAVVGQIVGKQLAPVLGSVNRWHVVYELLLTNSRPIPAAIYEIKVLDYYDNQRVLRAITEAEIIELSVHLSVRPRLKPRSPSSLRETPLCNPMSRWWY